MQRYISGNPYDLGRIVETLLGDVGAGDWEGAAAGRAILEAMAVRSSVIPVLDALLARRLTLRRAGARHYLAPDALGAEAIGRVEAILERASAWGQATLGLAAPALLLVRVLDDFAAPTYVAFDTPGLVLMQLPASLLDSEELERLLWHETGHCLLRCGLRFLDEGWATWVESQRGGSYDGAALLAAATAAGGGQYTLSELLSTSFTNALGFEDKVGDAAQRDSLYPKGALAVAAVVQRNGVGGVAALFKAIKAAPEQALRLFQEAIGQAAYGQLDAQLFRTAPAPALDDSLGRDAILAARAAGDGDALHDIAQRLFALAGQGAAGELATTLVDAYVSAREMRREFTPQQARQADQLATALLRRPPQRDLLELGARHTLVNLIDAQNFFDRATLAAKAQKLVQAACALQADTPDALLTRAHLLVHTPTQYGGDPDAGRALLRKVGKRTDQHGAIARGIYLQQFGEPPPEPAAVAAAAPVPPVAADAPLLLALDGLRFGRGTDFSLELERLELRAGEVLGVIGPNGAGKSLLLECCLGLQQFEATGHRLFGQDYAQWHRKLDQRGMVGAKLHRLGFAPGYRVSDIVTLARASFGGDDRDILAAFGIEPLLHKKYGWLSTGQRQRVDLYFAFHREARLLVLDEPTLGLDEEHTARLLQLIARRTGDGAAVLVVSHQRQILGLCHRIALLAGGRLQASGTPQALSERYLAAYRIDVDEDEAARLAQLAEALQALEPHALVRRQAGVTVLGDQAFLERFHAAAARNQWHRYQLRASELSDLYAVAGSIAQPMGVPA